MGLIYQYNKKTDTTYVYESQSYWRSDLKQSRSRRKLIGKLDKNTGEIIPTGKSGRRKKDQSSETSSGTASANNSSENLDYKVLYQQTSVKLEEQGKIIVQLKAENCKLSAEVASYQAAVNKVRQVIGHL